MIEALLSYGVLLLVFYIQFGLAVWVLWDARRSGKTDRQAIAWALLSFLFCAIGPLFWLFASPRKRELNQPTDPSSPLLIVKVPRGAVRSCSHCQHLVRMPGFLDRFECSLSHHRITDTETSVCHSFISKSA